MKPSILLLLTACLLAACANLERSRDLANPAVPPVVTAQQVCSNCHGLTGNSVSPQFPRLSGQVKEYIVAQLQNFRSRHRQDREYMWGIARNLTDAQIDGLAEYFSKQAPTPNATAALSAAELAQAKDIYEHGLPKQDTPPCEACHGPKAQGLATFPALAGQHADYAANQLYEFRETEMRPDTPMKQIMHAISPEQMRILSAYLQNFPGQ